MVNVLPLAVTTEETTSEDASVATEGSQSVEDRPTDTIPEINPDETAQ
jgi:hypothetical protein